MKNKRFTNVRTIELVNCQRRVKTLSMQLPEFGVDYEQLVFGTNFFSQKKFKKKQKKTFLKK